MKGLVLIFLARVAFSRSFVLLETVPECGAGSPTHIPHPTDCSKYYTCDEGVAFLQDCPPGLWWNVAVEGCDFPENTDCGAEGTTSSPGTTPVPPPECKPGSPAHLPHPTDCSKYYTCDDGVAILQECPPGLWWNGAFETCDFPENVDCSPDESTSAPPATTIPPPTIPPPTCGPESPTHIAHPTDCSKYYTCANGEAILQDCAPGLWWDVGIEGCDLPEHVDCAANGSTTTTIIPTTVTTPTTTTALPTCGPGSPTHIPHPTDCSKYYTCDEGVAILQDCPPGLWWNVPVEGCDFPENVECAAAGTTPPPESTTTVGTEPPTE